MESVNIPFSQSHTNFIFHAEKKDLHSLIAGRPVVFLADENVLHYHPDYLKDALVITIPAGENSKNLAAISGIIEKLIDLKIDRDTLLIGFGGGVICDITGFVAGIFKRGLNCAFIPSTILAMVDAAIGGKNGVNSGSLKNMIGLIRQPEFIFYDNALLDSLPEEEWSNGFAEIIKHACILDSAMFQCLVEKNLKEIKKDACFLSGLIKRNALLKAKVVQQDEFENGLRKQLNFGHTLGHAIERQEGLKHGFAVAVGMAFAAAISEKELGFSGRKDLVKLLTSYGLPVSCHYNTEKVISLMQSDKKRLKDEIQFILLKEIGQAVIQEFDFSTLTFYLKNELENLPR